MITDARDKGYWAFVKLVQEHPNIHFPRFIGKPLAITQHYNAVRMEKLLPAKNAPSFVSYLIAITHGDDYIRNPVQYEKFVEADTSRNEKGA